MVKLFDLFAIYRRKNTLAIIVSTRLIIIEVARGKTKVKFPFWNIISPGRRPILNTCVKSNNIAPRAKKIMPIIKNNLPK